MQSFVEAEARAAVRPQRRADVEAALGRIRDTGVPVLNIDLIYGIDGQTEESWRRSLDAALAWRPEELYLYPLYVRPLTGLGRTPPEDDREWDERRLRLYRHGRDHLLAHGYEQVSMRMFRRRDAAPLGPDDHACQTDGMIGLGCGARSYTSALHYSFDYAVDMREIRSIIDAYTETGDFSRARVGRWVDAGEARRRHLLQSLLQAEGMPVAGYEERFGSSPFADFPGELGRFEALGWLDGEAPAGCCGSPRGARALGRARSRAVLPGVRAAMAAYEPK